MKISTAMIQLFMLNKAKSRPPRRTTSSVYLPAALAQGMKVAYQKRTELARGANLSK